MNELANMRTFLPVAETGSFSAAARLLGISKSVVTKRINELETAFKTQLLRRTTRRVKLTDAGTTYLNRCRRILAEIDDAHTAVSAMTTGITGALRVSCIASFAARRLCADLREFLQDHPDLTLEMHHNDRVYEPVQEGYDLCIQPGDISGEAIVRRPIVTLRRLLLASPSYLKRHGAICSPGDLVRQRIAHNNFIAPGSILTLIGADGETSVPIRPLVLTNSVWMVLESVLSGDCIGILPTYFVVDEMLRGDLVPVLRDYTVPSITLSAYYRYSQHMPLKVRMLLRFLVERYQGTPSWDVTLAEYLPKAALNLR